MQSRQEQSLRVAGQQGQYLAHLRSQLVSLRDNVGAFGEVRLDVEDARASARQLRQRLHATEAALQPPLQHALDDDPTQPRLPPPQPADLDGLAGHLEMLARRIQEMEGVATAQGAGLRHDLARVMEVFEDPAAFLPTPVKASMSAGNTISPAPPAGSPEPARLAPPMPMPRVKPSFSSHLTSPLPSRPTDNFAPQARRSAAVAPMETTDSELAGLSASLLSPPSPAVSSDPLDQFRASIARDVHAWRTSTALDDSAEEVRRLARDAATNAQASARLQALANKTDARGGVGASRRARKPSKDADADQPGAPIRPAPRPKAVKAMQNPDLYPWSSQLQQIFKGVPSTADGPPMPPAPALPFGGLAQSIPAYIEYQAYVQEQILAQERKRQSQEARRLAEEKRDAEDVAAREAAAERRAKAASRAASMATTPTNAAQQSAFPFIQAPAPQQPPQRLVSTSVQTTPRAAAAASVNGVLQPLAPINGRPSHQLLGQHVPRFDAIWEVLPSAHDAAVQSDGAPNGGPATAAATHSARTAPSAAATPRHPQRLVHPSLPPSPSRANGAPRNVDALASSRLPLSPPASALVSDLGQQHETMSRLGGGAAAPPSRKPAGANALSVLEHAALELQHQARVRGEGLSSARALDSLLEAAHPYATTSAIASNESASSTDPISVPTHPLFSSTPSQRLSNYPSSGLLALVLQMYDMPSDLQVSQEWRRVLTEEEEREEQRRREAQSDAQPPEELKQPEEEKADAEPAAINIGPTPTKSPAEIAREELRRQAQQQQEAEARKTAEAQRIAAEQEIAHQRELSLESARAHAEAEAARLMAELQRVKEESAAAIAAAASANAVAAAAAPLPSPAALSLADVESQRAAWEADARRRWQAEQEALKAAATQAVAEALAAEDRAKARAREEAAQAIEADLARSQSARRAPAPTPSAEALAPAVANEVDRIRALQASEQSILDLVRAEEASRWSKEVARREEERVRLQAAHEADEARFAARRAEREAEESRRRDLERRRDELIQKKLNLEAERTRKEMESLRADVDRLRLHAIEPPAQVTPAFLNRTPLSTFKPAASRLTESSEGEDSWSSSSELLGGTGSSVSTGARTDLSEGEIDLRGASPGLILPPRIPSKLAPRTRKPVTTRHSAAVPLHSPIPWATPVRPVPSYGAPPRPSTAEQKYPHATERDSYASRDSFAMRDSLESDVSQLSSTGGAALHLRDEYNLPYASAVSHAKRVLAAPSRQVLVGPSSPPLVDDVSRLVRGSVDTDADADSARDAALLDDASEFGTSRDGIGGLFGFERPTSPASILSEPRDLEELSFQSTHREGDTEKWLQRLRESHA